MKKHTNNLIVLFENWFKEKPHTVEKLPQSGSYRCYYRMVSDNNKCLGVQNNDVKENEAFLSFTNTFSGLGLNVPELYAVSELIEYYLIEDLGDTTLHSFIKQNPDTKNLAEVYKKIADELQKFQFNTFEKINYKLCYPRDTFDEQSIRWDLNYFKYDFVKFLKISFDEQKLENDFNTLIKYLTSVPADSFMYRDFQSSNILLKEDKVYFIDYQGGRKGAFYYDLASLIFDAKANLVNNIKEEIIEYYFKKLTNYRDVDRNTFNEKFTAFALIRILQAMGAYGFRGLYERKAQFITSIPMATENLKYITGKLKLPFELPELFKIFRQLFDLPISNETKSEPSKLTVKINSFSYKKGIPQDNSGNGGGFVFDCRGLPNPGRFKEYLNETGKDAPVINFFKDKQEVQTFRENIFKIVDITVKDYLERKHTHLMINFGCTGGQHRSVYMAEQLAGHLKKYDLVIDLKHLEQEDVN